MSRDNEKALAAEEALRLYQRATREKQRACIVAFPAKGGSQIDVTEAVVDLLDLITQSLDWGSSFWNDTELTSFIKLCRLLKVAVPGED